MRLIDADALIEKCGGWYVDECTESGFIGTLENILATEPTIQPQSTAGQLNDSAQSTARSTDLIDRGQAIDAINHICPVDTEYDCTLLDRVDVRCVLSDLPSVRPEKAQLFSEGTTSDLISRQAAIEALNEYFARIGKLKRRGLTKGEKAISLDTVGTIKTLPSVQPEPQEGEWVQIQRCVGDTQPDLECPFCKHRIGWFDMGRYCAGCGAKLEGGAG